ncbi:MAG TPA: DinB family protein [Bryobacteraceae bacterium]|nr:DinB family protein [Bryobacteraceae bacterium]
MSPNAAIADLTLAPNELEQARLYLQQTRDGALGAVKGLSPAQWNFKPSPDRWSIAEILEHAVVVQERVLERLRAQIPQAPPPPPGYDFKQVDAIVIHQFPVRFLKFPAPEEAHPKGRWTPSEMQRRLIANCDRLAILLESTPDLRAHVLEGPPLKRITQGRLVWMDGYHWLLAAAAHTERHTKQMLEVKAAAGFPLN